MTLPNLGLELVGPVQLLVETKAYKAFASCCLASVSSQEGTEGAATLEACQLCYLTLAPLPVCLPTGQFV